MPTKIFTNSTLLTVGLLFAFASCSDKTPESTEAEKKAEPTFDLVSARKSVEEANQSLTDLLKKGDSVGFAGLYCSDAKVMGPDGPAVVGRDAIKATIGGMFRAGLTGLALKTSDVLGNDALLSEEGTYVFSMSDGKEIDHGKYIVLWKKEDGNWKLFRDIWNTDIPKPPTK